MKFSRGRPDVIFSGMTSARIALPSDLSLRQAYARRLSSVRSHFPARQAVLPAERTLPRTEHLPRANIRSNFRWFKNGVNDTFELLASFLNTPIQHFHL